LSLLCKALRPSLSIQTCSIDFIICQAAWHHCLRSLIDKVKLLNYLCFKQLNDARPFILEVFEVLLVNLLLIVQSPLVERGRIEVCSDLLTGSVAFEMLGYLLKVTFMMLMQEVEYFAVK